MKKGSAAAAAAQKDAKMDPFVDVPLKEVHLDALVVMKVIKHCTENFPDLVTGQLLGLDEAEKLEITNSFPFPKDRDDDELKGGSFQIQMMTNLREVNVESNVVGWYQTGYFGSFLTETLIESQFNYQKSIPKSVVIIYDPLKAGQGISPLKAFCLKKEFMALYKGGVFTSDSLKKAGLTRSSIFEEIPIVIRASSLAQALVSEVQVAQTSDAFEQLELSGEAFLEKNLENMIESVEILTNEQAKMQGYYRAHARQQQQQQLYTKKREAEQAQRTSRGEPPLEEEDLTQHPAFKQLNEPSQLEGLLVSNQIDNYCRQISQFAGQSLSKLFLAEGIFSRS